MRKIINRLGVDMDGLLTRFAQASLAAHGIEAEMTEITSWDFPLDFGFRDTWCQEFWEPLDTDFWANLPWHDEGRELLSLAEDAFGAENVFLVSTAIDFPEGCEAGKKRWIKANLPSYLKRHVFTPAKYALAFPGCVLIDDKDENADEFTDKGGTGIVVPRPWNRRRGECDRFGCFDPAKVISEAVAATRNLS